MFVCVRGVGAAGGAAGREGGEGGEGGIRVGGGGGGMYPHPCAGYMRDLLCTLVRCVRH